MKFNDAKFDAMDVAMENDACGEGRIKILKEPNGTKRAELIFGLDEVVHEEKTYEYRMDFAALKTMINKVGKRQDISKEVHEYFNKEPDIRFFGIAPNDSVEGKGFSLIEKTIFMNEQIDALANPSYGSITRMAKAGRKEIEVYVPLRDDDDGHDKYCKSLESRGRQENINVIINQLPYDLWPRDKKYYWGSAGYKLHNGDFIGIGIEFNPVVAQVFDVGITKLLDTGPCYEVEYIRNHVKHNFKYLKIPGAYRTHSLDYLSMRGVKSVVNNNIFNIVHTYDFNFYHRVHEKLDRMAYVVPDRAVDCCAERNVEIRVQGQKRVIEICKHGKAVDLQYPAYELSTRMKLCDEYNDSIDAKYCSYDTKYRVMSSIMSVYRDFDANKTDGVMYESEKLDFPSSWMIGGKGLYLRAWPDAYRKGDLWCIDGKVLPESHYYDKNLNVIFSPVDFFLSGKFTEVYYPSTRGMGKSMKDVGGASIVNDTTCITVDKAVNVKNTMLRLKYIRSGLYVYDATNISVLRTEVKRLGIRCVFGDATMCYNIMDPARPGKILIDTKKANDMFAVKIPCVAYSRPKTDSSLWFQYSFRDVKEIGEVEDYDTYVPMV